MIKTDLTDVDSRLDLDNLMAKIVENYDKTDDDFLFYIRGKISTNEFFLASASRQDHFGWSLYTIAINHKGFFNEIIECLIQLKKSGLISQETINKLLK